MEKRYSSALFGQRAEEAKSSNQEANSHRITASTIREQACMGTNLTALKWRTPETKPMVYRYVDTLMWKVQQPFVSVDEEVYENQQKS